jgi:DNA mismatch repair ATPase MutS
LHVAVLEQEGRITFLFKVLPGSTDRSYGVHAAEYAGVPAALWSARARSSRSSTRANPSRRAPPPVIIDRFKVQPSERRPRILPEAEPWQDRQLSLFDAAPPHAPRSSA